MCIRVRRDALGVKKAAQLGIVVEKQKPKQVKRSAILATIPAPPTYHKPHNISCQKILNARLQSMLHAACPQLENHFCHKDNRKLLNGANLV